MRPRDSEAAGQDPDEPWRQLAAGIDAARRSRQELLQGRGQVVSEVEALLFRHDPIGINFGHNTDEYRAEAETITIRLPDASGSADVRRIVHEEFVHWFDASIAGPPDRDTELANQIWTLWRPEAGT